MLILLIISACVYGHGHMTFPNSTRQGGSLAKGGNCENGACFWFSNNVEIPGEPTLPDEFRTVNRDGVGETDLYKTSPWRAPGTAPVFGSGCGSAGGGPVYYANGGSPPQGIDQGFDGAQMPEQSPVTWAPGSVQEVAWGISANHGGGYSYRLCKNDGNVTEECFQRTPLRFHGETSWIVAPTGARRPFNMTKVTTGTYPAGSEWAMDPVPGCKLCTAEELLSKCGKPLKPVPGKVKSEWDAQVNCYAMCDGAADSKGEGYCSHPPNFDEPISGISGFGKYVWDWSIMDKVIVPKDLESGKYLLSWRWDCEESTQVWQNCADIFIGTD